MNIEERGGRLREARVRACFWQGAIAKGLAEAVDLFPTLTELAGVPLPTGAALAGQLWHCCCARAPRHRSRRMH